MVSSFTDLPLAERSRRWNGGAAEKRVRAWVKAQDGRTLATAKPTCGTTRRTKTTSLPTSSSSPT